MILASVSKLLNSAEGAAHSAHMQGSSVGGDVMSEEPPTSTAATCVTRSAHAPIHNNQSEPTRNRKQPIQDGSAHKSQASSVTNGADAFNVLLNSLQAGQSMARNNLLDNSVSGPGLTVLSGAINSASANNRAINQSSTATISQSWRDSQIFFESAASGRSVPTHYDITDFITNTVAEEIVLGAMGPSKW